MKVSRAVQKILTNYDGQNPGIKTNLARMLMSGKLAGTGKMMILPVDQGFEHGPARSFAMNEDAYDPDYFFNLAIAARMNAYAAPLGLLEASADKFAGSVPMILKLNNNSSLSAKELAPNQAITASPKDALRLGCVAIGMTIYPGSEKMHAMLEEVKDLIAEARSYGLASIVWSYPRGGDLSKEGETAIDVCTYSAHIAALLGAHVIKVKLPNAHIEQKEAQKVYKDQKIKIDTLSDRVKHVTEACFKGKRLVIFSGGASKGQDTIFDDAKAIYQGGGSGMIIGRNSFQRKKDDAVSMLNQVTDILAGK